MAVTDADRALLSEEDKSIKKNVTLQNKTKENNGLNSFGKLKRPFQHYTNVVIDYFVVNGKPTLVAISEWPMILQASLLIVLTWILGWIHVNPLLAISWMVFLLWKVHSDNSKKEIHIMRAQIRKENIQKSTPDEESVEWMNTAMERMWPLCLEKIVSQHLVTKLAPFFLNKYKPPVLTKLELISANMGSQPPVVTSARVYNRSADGNHLEMEMVFELVSAPDMFLKFTANVGSASMLGLGLIPWTAYATNLNFYGKAHIGVRFSRTLPFVDHVTVSFLDEPDFTLAIKVMGMGIGKGFDAAGLPLVADYVKYTLKNAISKSVVAPNQLIIDDILALSKGLVDDILKAEKTAGTAATVDVGAANEAPATADGLAPVLSNRPIAMVHLEVLEGVQLVSADVNGFSDPYVKGTLGPLKFTTSIKKKTCNPRWLEEFSVPIHEWGDDTALRLHVRDYDRFTSDDDLGSLSLELGQYRDGQRHEVLQRLQGCKTGKLRLAVTVNEAGDENVETEQKTIKTSDGGEADVKVTTAKKEDGTVTYASGTLLPTENETIGKTSDQKSRNEKKAAKTMERKVSMGESLRQEVTPGMAVVSWEL